MTLTTSAQPGEAGRGYLENDEKKHLRIVIDGRYINDAFPGIGRYTYNLIVSLARVAENDTLIILTNSLLPNRRYDIGSLARLPACHLVNCSVDRFLPSELLNLAPVVRNLNPDLFHSPFFLYPYSLACPGVLTIHDLHPMRAKGQRQRINYIIFRLGMHMAMRKAAALLTVSEVSAKDLRLHWPVAGNRIFVTPLAPDPKFRPMSMQETQQLLHPIGLNGGRYVFHVSSGMGHKNVELLLRAWGRRSRGGFQTIWKLVLAGNYGRYGKGIVSLAERLGIKDSVAFLGDVDEDTLVALYNRASLFVFPSSIEGFGFPIVEAMACGTPVLTTEGIGVVPDLADAVWKIPPDNLDALVEGLAYLQENEGARRTLSERGLVRAQHFSWEATAEATWRIYRDVVNRARDYASRN